jgi:hypothetical protein
MKMPINEYASGTKLGAIIGFILCRLFKSKELIEVKVGRGAITASWLLGREFLFTRMPAFRSRLEPFMVGSENASTEGTTPTPVMLKNVEPAIFGMALDWFFTGTLECCYPHDNQANDQNTPNNHFAAWCALHVFAESYELGDLSAHAVRLLEKCLTHTRWYPTTTEIQYVFHGTPEHSPLRSILVSEVTKSWTQQPVNDFKEHMELWMRLINCNAEFHARLLLAVKIQHNTKVLREARAQESAPVSEHHGRSLRGAVVDLTETL